MMLLMYYRLDIYSAVFPFRHWTNKRAKEHSVQTNNLQNNGNSNYLKNDQKKPKN